MATFSRQFTVLLLSVCLLASVASAQVIVPIGDNPQNTTLDLGYKVGGSIIGSGDGEQVKPTSPSRGPISALVRTDNSTVPMVAMPGSDQRIENVALYGCPFGVTKPRDEWPSAGILIDYAADRSGIGTGKHFIENVTARHFKNAIQFGHGLKTRNCDNTTINKFSAYDCENVILSTNAHSMGHVVRDLHCRRVDCIFNFEAGGNFMADTVTVKQVQFELGVEVNDDGDYLAAGPDTWEGKPNPKKYCVVLKLGSRAGIGSNNGQLEIRNFFSDSQCGPRVRLLEMTDHCNASVKIVGGMIKYDWYAREDDWQILVKSPGRSVVTDFIGLQPGAIIFSQRKKDFMASLTLERSTPRGIVDVSTLTNPTVSQGKMELIASQRRDENNVTLPAIYHQVIEGSEGAK